MFFSVDPVDIANYADTNKPLHYRKNKYEVENRLGIASVKLFFH